MRLHASGSYLLTTGTKPRGDDACEHDSTGTGQSREFEYYERRHSIRMRLRKGDWWITVGLYLLTCILAFILIP
jgi:hypothetical protein